MRAAFVIAIFTIDVAAQTLGTPPRTLPVVATEQLAKSLSASSGHASHIWRDTPPVNSDGTINGYIEIPLGERRKFEFDMNTNTRFIDRVMPPEVGGYPVNYGFVPQTVSYDGDPFDILVLGPALPGGRMVRGTSVGVMFMEDEKGLDSKVVVSTLDSAGKPRYKLTSTDQKRIGDFFARYKKHEPGKFSKVAGWGSAAEGLAFVQTTHAFFRQCVDITGPCALRLPGASIGSPPSPVMIAKVVGERTLRPVVAIATGEFHRGWPEDVEKLGKAFPMPLASIPKDWISPLSSLPGNWMVFVDDGRKISARAVEVVTLSGDNPVEAAIRISADATWNELTSAVAVAGAADADVNFVEDIEPESPEGRRLAAIARRLVVDDILSEVTTQLARVDVSLRDGVFLPPREAVRLTEPVEVTIRRPRRALADGNRPVLVDYMVKYSKSPGPDSCDTQAHVRSWFNEGSTGLVRSLSTGVNVGFGCEWMGIDSFPDAVVRVAGHELWIGLDNYEDGTTYEAWLFRNGKLENVNPFAMNPGGSVSRVPPSVRVR